MSNRLTLYSLFNYSSPPPDPISQRPLFYVVLLLLAITFLLLTSVRVVVSLPLLDITVVVVCWTIVDTPPPPPPPPLTGLPFVGPPPPPPPFKELFATLIELPFAPTFGTVCLANVAAIVWLGEEVGVEAKEPFVELAPLLFALASSTTVMAT